MNQNNSPKRQLKAAEVGLDRRFDARLPEILKALRGKLSQKEASERMGYVRNQVWYWESGRSPMKWEAFVEFCSVLRLPLRDALAKAFYYRRSSLDSKDLAHFFIGDRSPGLIAAKLGVSRDKIFRWRNGRAKIKLTDLLLLASVLHQPIDEFFRELGAPIDRDEAFDLLVGYPMTAAVIALLQVKKGRMKYKRGVLTKLLPIPMDAEVQLVEDMIKSGLVDLKDNELVLKNQKCLFQIRNNRQQIASDLHFWSRVCVSVVRGDLVGYGSFRHQTLVLTKNQVESVQRKINELVQQNVESAMQNVCKSKHDSDLCPRVLSIQFIDPQISWDERCGRASGYPTPSGGSQT